MTHYRFADALLKYAHAQTHLATLDKCLEAYELSYPWSPEKTDDVPEGMVRICFRDPIPIEIGLILGDCCHNLRSSLDYATCSLVEASGKADGVNHVQFPFGTLGRQLNRNEKARLKGIKSDLLEVVEEVRELYGAPLQLLNSLSNQDKHRLLVATTMRQHPLRIDIDEEAKTAHIVSDFASQPDVWNRLIRDGDIIPMPTTLKLDVGIVVADEAQTYPIALMNAVNKAVDDTLQIFGRHVHAPSSEK